MANWKILKAAISNAIKSNGNYEITGQLLQNTLNNIVDAIGANAAFAGIAEPSTVPETPDGRVYYITATAGTYSNFGNVVVNEHELAIIVWNNKTWQKALIVELAYIPESYSEVEEKAKNSLQTSNVKQNTGTSLTDVMSQKAVTDVITDVEKSVESVIASVSSLRLDRETGRIILTIN